MMKLIFTYSLFSAMLSWFGVPETNPTLPAPVKHTPESVTPQSSYIRVAADWGLLYGHLDLPLKDAVEITRLADRTPVGMSPIIAVTKVYTLSNDTGLAGPSPGDELTYTITITNSGAMDATALTFTDQIDANTTLVAGSLKRSPILYADTYNCIGNVGLDVNTPAGGVIGNDLDLDGDVIQATNVNQTGTQGLVLMNPDGTFSFKPNPGFEGTTTFTYTASDGLFASVGTVTINVSRMIWFVDNNAGVNGDGRLGTPFNSMANFNAGAADDAGDIIFLYRNTASNYAGPLTLLNNQYVIGAGASSSIASIAGITVPSFSNTLPSTGGTNPVLAHTATNLTLGQNNKLHGFDISNTVGGVGLTGTGTSALQIRDVSISHTAGQALNLTTAGALDVILKSVSAAGTGTGMLINGATGSFQIAGTGTTNGSGGTISNITNRGVDIQNATNITLKNMTFTNANTVDAGTCNAANNTLCNAAIHLGTVTTAVLNNVDINGTTEQGINLSSVTGFSLIGSDLINCGVASSGTDTEESCLYGVNVDGTCAITNSSLTKPSERAAVIYNTNKTLALTVTGSTFGDNQTSTLGADGLEIDNLGSSNLTLDVVNTLFTKPKTNGLQVISDNTAVASVDITGSTFDAGPSALAAAIDLVTAGTANMDFNIIGNPLIKSRGINAVNIQGQGSSTFQGRIKDNSNITTTSGSGIPVRVLATANSIGKVLIQNNVLAGADDYGLICGSNGGTGRLDANILSNNISVSSLGFYCIQAIAGASSSMFTNKTCANIVSNTVNPTAGAIGHAQYRAATPSHMLLVQGGGATAATNWNANTNSPTSPTATISQSGTGSFTFGSTCNLPTNPLPLMGDDPVAGLVVADPGADVAETNTVPDAPQELSATPATPTNTETSKSGKSDGAAEKMMSGETVTTGPVTIPANSDFRIRFRATIDSPFPAGVCSVSNQATVSGSNFSTVLSDDPGIAGAANPTVTTVNSVPAITTCPPNLTVDPNNSNCTSTQAFAAVATGCPTPTVTYKIGATTITSPFAFPSGLSTVDVTAANGNLPNATCSFTVTVSNPPTAFNVTGGGPTCPTGAGSPINLSGSQVGVNYQLLRGVSNVGSPLAGTGSALSFPPQVTAGTYTVVATGVGGCTVTMNGSAIITVGPCGPTVNVTPASVTCSSSSNGSILVTASGSTAPYNVSWAGPSSGDPAGTEIATSGGTYNISGLTAGTYTVSVTDASSMTTTATAVVGVTNPNPPAAIMVAETSGTVNNDGNICIGASATLTGTGGVSYAWSTTENTTAITVTPASTATYTVTVTSAAGCTATATTTITVNPLPTPGITVTETSGTTINDGITCAFQTATLTATGGSSYMWSVGGFTTAGILVNPGATTTYTVTVTNANGCSATSSTTITVNPLPTPGITVAETSGTINNDGVICVGATASLTGTGGTSYAWSTSENTAAINVTPASTTTYTVTVTNANGCTATSTTTITVNPLPTPGITVAETSGTINNDGVICVGATASLTGTGGTSYAWSTTENTAAINVTPASTTTYTVTVTNANGCTATSTSTITVNPLPTPGITVAETSGTINNDGVICVGATASLTGTGGTSYAWNTGDNTAAINVTPASTTTYTVTVTNANGCTATSTTTITVNPLPTPGIMVSETSGSINNDGVICGGATVSLTGTGGTSYAWNTGDNTAAINVTPASTTTYTVTVTNANGCTATSTTTITVNPSPTPGITVAETSGTINNDGLICIGATATLTGTGGTSYAWSTTENTAAINVTPASTTTYTVTVTNANGCTATSTRTITVNPLPTPGITVAETSGTVNNDGVICTGATASLTGTGGTSYAWNTGDNTAAINVTPASTTTYTVTVTNANGCTATSTTTITVNPLPTPGIMVSETSGSINNDGVICGGATVSLTGTGGTSYAWNTGDNTAAINVTPASTTTYTVTVTNANGCTATSTTTITVNPSPTPGITVAETSGTINNDGLICVGATASLTGTGGASYAWNTGDNTAAINVTPASTTTYTVTVTNANGCTATSTRTITVNPLPTPGITVAETSGTVNNDGVICVGATATLTGTGGTSYAWSTGDNTAAINVTPASTTTYTVTVTNAGGCTATSTTTITVNPLPTPGITVSETSGTINNDGVICAGATATLTGTGGTSYAWSTGVNTAAINVTPASTTTYTVTVTNANNCSSTATTTITVNPLPTPSIAIAETSGAAINDGEICLGATATLTASGGTAYAWSTGVNTAAIMVTPAVTTTYTVTVTNANNCTATATTTITVTPLPVGPITVAETSGTANNDGIICVGASVGLTAPAAANYSWSTGDNTATITVTPASTTTYTVTVTNANSCISTATVTITVNPLPTPGITVSETSGTINNDGVICAGATASLTGTGGTSYAWSTGDNTAAINVTPASTTTYTVTVTNANNCSSTATTTITVNPLPTPAIVVTETSGTTNNDGIICTGATANLTASGGTSYAWSNGINTAANPVTPASTTTYTVTVTNANNCSSTATTTITVNPLPTPGITVAETSGTTNNDGIICIGATATLTASGGTSYAWSNGVNTAANPVTPASTTTYTVTVTNANGCSATATTTITVNPLPTPATTVAETSGTTANDGIICAGASATITASGGTAYAWSTGMNTAAITVTPASTTTYTVTVTNANGCSATSTRTITVNPLPTPAIAVAETSGTTNNDGIICVGASATLTASGGTAYAWSTGGNIAAILVTPAATTTYTVTVTNANGCSATATTTITVNPLPINTFTVTGGGGFCQGSSTVPVGLSGSQVGVNYQLQINAVNNGAPVAGTGAALNFGNFNIVGTYTVIATTVATGCSTTMTGSVTVFSFNCTPTISDPCVCLNNATTLTNGQFGEQIKVNAPSNQTWTVSAVTGLYTTGSPAPPSAPIAITVGTVMTNIGGNMFTLDGRHIDAIGYTISVTNGAGTTLSIGNSCQYPNPSITSDLSGPFCLYSAPVTLTGNPGDGSVTSQTFTVNGTTTTTFDPGAGVGQYTIVYTVNGGAPKATGPNDPGCIQSVSQIVNVVATPSSLICNDLVYVSLDVDCVTEILPDDILEGTYGCDDDYTVELDKTVPYGNGPWVPATVGISDVGQTYQVRITHLVSGNKCWGNVKIEDKLEPVIECTDIDLSCPITTYDPAYLLNVLGIADAYPDVTECSAYTLSYVDTWHDLACNQGFNGVSDLSAYVARKWTAKDAWNNTSTCIQYIYFHRVHVGDVDFPADYIINCDGNINIDPSVTGVPYYTDFGINWKLFPDPGFCELQAAYTDQILPVCDGSYKILRTWTLVDWCLPTTPFPPSQNPLYYIQLIKVLDSQGPAMVCPANLTVSTDPYNCCATTNLPDVIIEDNCSRVNNISAMVTTFDPYTGDQTGMYTVGGSLTTFPGNNYWDLDTLGNWGWTPCLPVGRQTVVYTAEDDCGNTSTCSFRLTVADYQPPVAACDQYTVVAIGTDDPADCYTPADGCDGAGVTWIHAKTFDDGSTDNCNGLHFTIRRMDPYSDCINGLEDCEKPTATEEQDSIKFYCCEVGTTQTVILRVYQVDQDGAIMNGQDGTPLYNECMVNVEVQDKIKPVCLPPANVTVACENFDASLWVYGKATVYDNCCLDTTKVYQGQCGLSHSANYNLFDTVCSKGTITRTFKAYDCHGLTSQCTQRVVVQYNQDYYVKFPNDVIVTVCDGTGTYGEPTFFGEDCELLGVSYEDQVFTVVPDACFKIERVWTIINWCTYNPNLPCIDVPNPNPNAISNNPANLPGPIVSRAGTLAPWAPTVVKINPTDATATNYSTFWQKEANCYKYKQIIKVIDTQDPVVENCPASPVEVCDITPNDPLLWNESYWWDNLIGQHDLCEGPTDLTITATDACSAANINFRYLLFLDLDNDGTMETVINSVNTGIAGLGWNAVPFGNGANANYTGGTLRAFDGRPVPFNQKYGFAIQTTTSGTKKTASVRWNTQQSQSNFVIPELPYGTHKIKWFVEDGCGNESVCEYTFIVKDCKKPTVVCLNGLSVNIMPTQMIQLWASDFLKYTEDNCTPANQLKIAIRKSGTGTGFPVDGNGNPITNVTFTCDELGTQLVELWSIDKAGNADFCETYVIVQDNNGNCPNVNAAKVAGALATEGVDGVEEGAVEITGSSNAVPSFTFTTMSDNTGAYNFNAIPLASNSTVTPAKDDNPLNGVSTYDLVLISKHILGIEALNTPFKMIAADANKSGSITTFDIVELRKLILGIYSELPTNTSWRFVDKSFNFPNTANPFQTQFAESKAIQNLAVDQVNEDFISVKVGDVNGTAIANSLMSADDRTAGTLLFDVNDQSVRAGETFTVTLTPAQASQGYQFTLNTNGLEVVDIAGLKGENYAVFAGATTFSVDGADAQSVVTLTLKATKAGKVSELLSISSRITKAEAYSNGKRLEVAFRFNNGGVSTISGVGFELYQNQPNPFVNKTFIGFHLPEATSATLSIYDETGRTVFTQNDNFAKGYNTITIDRALLNTTGMLYYKLETATDSATKKMIQSK